MKIIIRHFTEQGKKGERLSPHRVHETTWEFINDIIATAKERHAVYKKRHTMYRRALIALATANLSSLVAIFYLLYTR